MGRARVGVDGGSVQAPEAHLGDQRDTFRRGACRPRVRGVGEVGSTVVTETHPMGELPRESRVTGGVVEEPVPLPHADEPGERGEVGGEVGRQLEHDAFRQR